MRAALIGKTLKHSFSKQIHQAVGVCYDLVEVSEENLQNFVLCGGYDNFNVTVPYKEKILPFLDRLDDSAKEVGCVNTVKRVGKKTVGYNTDIDGMAWMFSRCGVSLTGKSVTVLGTGGTSKTAQAFLKRQNAHCELVGLEGTTYNYQNVYELTNTQVIINTTPVGMYPDCGKRLVELSKFPHLEFVADVIYNPHKTQILLDAEKLHLPFTNGLPMLIYQALVAEEIWSGNPCTNRAEELLADVMYQTRNVVLVGMPACGKTTVGKAVAQKLNKRFVDLDEEIVRREQMPITEIFRQNGEAYFRRVETEVCKYFCMQSGLVVATGGGTPITEQNRDAIRQNGFVVWLQRDLDLLTDENRPVTQQRGVQEIFKERSPFYRSVSDFAVQNINVEEAAEKICSAFKNNLL